ncbi:MAG: hypothetical protein KY475_25710 [Planctomycetes bacterium]|nr:hypothetical protein [Planctomycetota bacterium]
MQFYIDRDGDTDGPFSPEKILGVIRQSELAGDHLLWLEGTPMPISVADLLAGRDAASVDSRVFDKLRPAPRRWTRDRRRDEDIGELFEIIPCMLGLVPGCGCVTAILGSLSGGGLIAVLCVGLYLWGTIDVNRRGAQEQRLEALCGSIAAYADRHPEAGRLSLEQLRKAGVIADADLKLMEQLGVEFHPVAADSPSTALVFVRRTDSTERRYYKGEEANFVIWWPSPDKRFTLFSAPESPSSKSRVVTIRNEADGRTILRYETDAFMIYPKWSPDSRLVAVEETFAGADRLRLLSVREGGVREIPLPAEIAPESLLPLAGGKGEPKWCSNCVDAQRWLDSRRLEIESFGNVSFVGENKQPRGSVSARYCFVLGFEESRVTVLDRERVSFYES